MELLVLIVNRQENVLLLGKAVKKLDPKRVMVVSKSGTREAVVLYNFLLNSRTNVGTVEVDGLVNINRLLCSLPKKGTGYILSAIECDANMIASYVFCKEQSENVRLFWADTYHRKLVEKSPFYESGGGASHSSLDEFSDDNFIDRLCSVKKGRRPKKTSVAMDNLSQAAESWGMHSLFPSVTIFGMDGRDGTNRGVNPSLYCTYKGINFAVWVVETNEQLIEALQEVSIVNGVNGGIYPVVYANPSVGKLQIAGMPVIYGYPQDVSDSIEGFMYSIACLGG